MVPQLPADGAGELEAHADRHSGVGIARIRVRATQRPDSQRWDQGSRNVVPEAGPESDS